MTESTFNYDDGSPVLCDFCGGINPDHAEMDSFGSWAWHTQCRELEETRRYFDYMHETMRHLENCNERM